MKTNNRNVESLPFFVLEYRILAKMGIHRSSDI